MALGSAASLCQRGGGRGVAAAPLEQVSGPAAPSPPRQSFKSPLGAGAANPWLCVTASTAPVSPALARVGRIAPNRAAAPHDLRFGQNERIADSAIWRFCNSKDQWVST